MNNERTTRANDLRNADLHVVNGFVCDWKDYFGEYPTVSDARDSWKLKMNDVNSRLSDRDIEIVILCVRNYDNHESYKNHALIDQLLS